MIAPLSWLKQYVPISLDSKILGEKLTEVGLGTERIERKDTDTIFHLEITPNRPDWLSIVGVAREIAAITGKKISYPKLKTDLKPKKNIKLLSLKIHPSFSCSQRMTGIIVDNVMVKESPMWLKEKLLATGQRPINNIVDITNFVMWELGNPIHSFDYDKIDNHEMWVEKAKGGESFESVDEVSYILPKGAIIYKDANKIFDLAGIKGGRNSGTYQQTKTVFILVAVDDPVLIRKTSQALSLRSDASAIFERAVNKGGTIDALKRTVDLIIECAGGNIASKLIDLKEQDFVPWKLSLRLDRLAYILGIHIPKKDVFTILKKLNLLPRSVKKNIIETSIPTYRNDLQIEEDLIEEVARLYGYNNFPKTMIEGEIAKTQIPFYKNYKKEEEIKHIIQSVGFNEVYTYSLVSKTDLVQFDISPKKTLKVANPVSQDFEYLRPTLRINLFKALRENKANFSEISIFELGKVYLGEKITQAKETYFLSGISNTKNYFEIKGMLEAIFSSFSISEDPSPYITIFDEGIFFELDFSLLLLKKAKQKVFQPIPKYPSITEDLACIVPSHIKIGDIITLIRKQSILVVEVSLLDTFKDTRTFHIVYQNKQKNLTNEDVGKIRKKIISALLSNLQVKLKE